MAYKFDLDLIKKVVPTVFSWRALALAIDLRYPSCAVYTSLPRFCKLNSIDCSHFVGKKQGLGKPGKRRDIQDYLSNKASISSHSLKCRLIHEKIKEHKCEICNRTEWNGQVIPIDLHHIDGNSENNALSNLQILCRNCHGQTENFCGKHVKKQPKPFVSDELLIDAIQKSSNISQALVLVGLSTAAPNYRRARKLMNEKGVSLLVLPEKTKPVSDPFWRNRFRFEKRKVERPTKEELGRLVWEKPCTQIAKDFGVTDNAIKKWCKLYGIIAPPRGYWAKIKAGFSHEKITFNVS